MKPKPLGRKGETLTHPIFENRAGEYSNATTVLDSARYLEAKEHIQPSHVTEAVQYRTLDRTAW